MWCFLLLSSLVAPGHASQVHFDSVTLEDVVGWSTAIVLVTPADPPSRILEVPLTDPGGPWPAYETALERLRVVEVLRAPKGLLSPGQVIDVGAATAEAYLSLHRQYTVHGISRSPIFPAYESSLDAAALPERRIVLLRPCTIGSEHLLCYSASGAVEAEATRTRIEAAFPTHPGPDPGPETAEPPSNAG